MHLHSSRGCEIGKGGVCEIGVGWCRSGRIESEMRNIALCTMAVKLDFVVYGDVDSRCFD